jgi:TM2 domain-containing membrane protein YozV
VNQPATKYCFACAASIDARAEICPKCGVRQQGGSLARAAPADPAVRQASGNKMAAGLCGIFLGALGIHKFVLGLTTPGAIMLLVSLLTCGFGAIPMGIIGLVEGIIYLSKSDEDFYEIYVVEKKGWF